MNETPSPSWSARLVPLLEPEAIRARVGELGRLIGEDIIDTGLTLSFLRENPATRRPASIRLAALLHKPARTVKPVPIEYLGFTVADEFVVGYGLDHDGLYRNLPGIALFDALAQLQLFETDGQGSED